MTTIAILPSDRAFQAHEEEGDAACLCSRCGLPIPERDVAIRAWPADGSYEYRFHAACLGFVSFGDDDEEGD